MGRKEAPNYSLDGLREGGTDYLAPLPNQPVIKRGLVTAGDRAIVRGETRASLLKSLALWFLGAKTRGDEIYKKVLEEEMKNLALEMEQLGLLGEHPLVDAPHVLREQISQASGSFSGSLFGITGSFESSSQHITSVLFAWQSARGIIFSEIGLKQVLMTTGEMEGNPTVEFEFDANRLISQPLYAKGALVRKIYGHPNGYIDDTLVRAIFKTNRDADIWKFLVPITKNPQLPER